MPAAAVFTQLWSIGLSIAPSIFRFRLEAVVYVGVAFVLQRPYTRRCSGPEVPTEVIYTR